MGIGYQGKLSEETTSRWWENVYDKAASNLSSTDTSGDKSNSIDPTSFSKLTDEELFEACGGRTAHKAARHGLRLSGKLKRIVHQEKTFTDDKSGGPCKKKSEKSTVDESITENNDSKADDNLKVEHQKTLILETDSSEIRKKKKHKNKLIVDEVLPVDDSAKSEKIVTKKKKKRKVSDGELTSQNILETKKKRR